MIEAFVSAVFQGREDGDPKLAINRVVKFIDDVQEGMVEDSGEALHEYVEGLANERGQRSYPPELVNQQYQRTYAMQAGYSAEYANAQKAFYIQSVPNRRYVVDREYQAAIHQGRHETMQDDIESTIDDFASELKAELLKRYGN